MIKSIEKLFEHTQKILNKYDFQGLIKGGAPEDEYDPEVRALVLWFVEHKDPKIREVATELHSIFCKYFWEDTAGEPEQYVEAAGEILN